ncbi:SagB/ThcOx family dehydrogenase [Ideonella sp. BN130291]|uniref:SagB/ThcOx family dehydrogenase n=1 Tax=Ideonella sp. BN130291 TaxID=3112940 RepID=UPI002E272BA5|nr:SagB family peptide dehydrogenase [Ideonella sp. BN130291]
MNKLFWVMLPLLAAFAWLGQRWLRGRAPSRHAMNVGISLLLMAYVLATAGLGLFWIANQQLPVFDWHYLFGYGTLLLVVVHLAFNFRVVWRFLRGPRAAAVPASPARRGLLAGLGALLAGALGIALGLRHGRSEVRIEAAAGPYAAPAAGALAAVERLHEFSSHSRAGVMLRAPSVDWGAPPVAFKRYPDAMRVALPGPRMARGRAVTELGGLGAVLWHTAGVSAEQGGLKLRASPSSGALFATELYVAGDGVQGLAPGLWHYDALGHALERSAPADRAAALMAAAAAPGRPVALVVATAVFRRTGQKYRDRSYRYEWADLGHALENLRLAASAVGGFARLLPAFDETEAGAALGLDNAQEGVLALVALYAGAPPKAAVQTQPLWQPVALSPTLGGLPLGVTAAAHAFTALRAASAGGQPAREPAASAAAVPTQPASALLPRLPPLRQDALGLIATRRSRRRFAAEPLPLEALAAVLQRMVLGEAPLLSDATRVYVVAHAVAGLPAGAYRYRAEAQALRPTRAPALLRDTARAAALDQDVIGDAAAVCVIALDRAALAADPLGPGRAYRHAFIEAGLQGERLYLEAEARGLAACAVGAFYDDEAARLVALDPAQEWVLHFAALGPRA